MGRMLANLWHGVYGNQSEVNTVSLFMLTDEERAIFYASEEVRGLLAELPHDAAEERERDAARGVVAFLYQN